MTCCGACRAGLESCGQVVGCAKEHPNRNERKGRQDVPVTPHTVGKKRNGSPLQVEWYGHSGKQLDTFLKSNNKYHATHTCAPNHPIQRKENLHQHENLIVQSGFACRSPDQPKGASASKWSPTLCPPGLGTWDMVQQHATTCLDPRGHGPV